RQHRCAATPDAAAETAQSADWTRVRCPQARMGRLVTIVFPPGKASVIGIDPGAISAAYGLIPWDLDGGVDAACAFDMPVVDRMVDAKAFAYIVRSCNPNHAVIERVNAFPGQGVSSAFRFGQ